MSGRKFLREYITIHARVLCVEVEGIGHASGDVHTTRDCFDRAKV
jgi:hypothetical protein